MTDKLDEDGQNLLKKKSMVLYSSIAMITYGITIPFAISRFTWTLYTDDPSWSPHRNFIKYHISTLMVASILWCAAGLNGIFSTKGKCFKHVCLLNIIAVLIAEVMHIIDVIVYLKNIYEPDLLSSSFTHGFNYLVFNTIFGLGIILFGNKYCCDKCGEKCK